jgi:hypothetical protein
LNLGVGRILVVAVDVDLVGAQVEFVFKDDKACRQTLFVGTKKMIAIKMNGEGGIIFEKLIGFVLFLTDMTLVMILVQMLMQQCQIIKAFGPTKFTHGMSRKARSRSFSPILMLLELRGRKPGQQRNEISLGLDTQMTERQSMLHPQMFLQGRLT